MATLSYTLYDYAHLPAELLETVTATASFAYLTISTNGRFPNSWWLNENGEWEHPDIDGSLKIAIDGITIGTLFDGPPGDDGSGYFVDSGGDLPYGTAVIPEDVWQSIIADGQLQISYLLGGDADSLARPSDYIRAELTWFETDSQYSGSPGDDDMMTNGPALILGLGGNDIITGNIYDDTIHGGAGNDNISDLGGDDVIRGNDGNDLAFGGAGDDYVSGGNGNDELSGGEGSDVVRGDAGNDNLFGDLDDDVVRGGDGLDSLSGGSGDDLLWGGADRDWLWGDDGADRLRGEAGNDDLDGGRGDDTLWGGAGDDRMWGNRGNNHLWGGDGADQFMFYHADQAGTQHVYDFDRSEGDKLMYFQAFDQVIDDYDIRVGKDGTVVTIADTTIVLSGVFDLTPADITFLTDADWPWF